jgi:hypothetical protein
LVREGDQTKEQLEAEMRQWRQANDARMIQLADYLFEHQRLAARFREKNADATAGEMIEHFAILNNKIKAVLHDAGVSFHDPVGEKLGGALLECVEIRGWLPAEEAEERVHETIAPIVRRNSAVIRPGRVIGRSPHANDKPSGGYDDHQ